MRRWLTNIYETMVLDRPWMAIFLVALVVAFFGFYAPQFRLDASSDSLTLENDQALKYYRSIKMRYGSDDYLVITYTPKADLFSPQTLTDLKTLSNSLAEMERVESVTSILNVPLVQSPPVTLEELQKNIPTLEGADIELARQELTTGILYKDLMVSKDGRTTALFVNFKVDKKLQQLLNARNGLRERSWESALTAEQKQQLAVAEKEYTSYNAKFQVQWQEDIDRVRQVLLPYKDKAGIHIGGVPMVIADSIDFISKDLKNFGLGILAFLVVFLALIFRRAQWVLLPLAVCSAVGITVLGFLGLVDWPVTVISANFIALLLILTLSFCVHQIERYQECCAEKPTADQRALVLEMVRTIGIPCFYMVFTTIVAFGSLVVSNIRPIIDFGWMMSIGLAISFMVSFTLFPAVLVLLKPEKITRDGDMTERITTFFAKMIHRHKNIILAIFAFLIVMSVWGISRLYVQNSFIDYYKDTTEIHRGMVTIDRKLGGTTPLDIIIDAPQSFINSQKEESEYLAEEGLDFGDTGPAITEGYWFGDVFLDQVAAVHDYLDSLPESGKVLSLHTTLSLLQGLKDAKPVDRFYLGVIYSKLPKEAKAFLFDPYISDDGNQLRFSLRVFESMEGLDRQKLIEKIESHLTTELRLQKEQVHTTGMVVLYNNVLQSLFRSQILTVWVVFMVMFFVFILLFRNLKVAAVAIIPNIMITAMVLGIMGWMGIPLDIMTITIAAICFGTADDNTIHYTHRAMVEFKKDGNYWKAIDRSHTTIGRAMYYTGITVILGFSILSFSNFVPTIYFGLLTAFSMLMALLANLVLLPLLLLLFKPFGKEQ